MLQPRLLINDIRRQNQSLANDIEKAVKRVLDAGWYILGPEVSQFENEFASYCGSKECVTTANGTDALELALRAFGIGAGDRVGTVANAGGYASTAILRAGAIPVFLDVDEVTWTMSPQELSEAKNLRAAIVTHLYGRMADMPALLASGVPLIEDCAQAHGARLQGRAAGASGVAGCFSFYPTKNLGALGDGGAVITNDDNLADRIRALRQYGWKTKYISEVPGGRNSRMDSVQAAILRAKLPYLDQWNRRRRELAARYDQAFGKEARLGEDYVAHLYVIRIRQPDRDRLRELLASRGIATEVHYPVPDYRQPSIAMEVRLSLTEQLCEQVLTLPLFPEMTDQEAESVIEAVLETGQEVYESLLI